MAPGRLIYGDNLVALREIGTGSVDLVYLDPPFQTGRPYRTTGSNGGPHQDAFDDRWKWNGAAERMLDELSADYSQQIKQIEQIRHIGQIGRFVAGMTTILGKSGMLAYLLFMAPRLVELHRVLKPTGSIYLHCDQTASAHLRLLMDALFAPENFLNCIVWCYGLGGSTPRRYPRKHDDILWYSREAGRQKFHPPLEPAESQRMQGQLRKTPDYWPIASTNNMARERTGYPTQKPLPLLERIVASSSDPGDTILDPFCGSGTTLVAAARLGRRWIGIDSSREAVAIARQRLVQVGKWESGKVGKWESSQQSAVSGQQSAISNQHLP